MSEEVEIIHLEFPESIRSRPGMYGCDTTDRILIREVIDNCLDLVLKNNINLDIKAFDNVLNTGYKYVIDNGTGIPLYESEKTGMSIALDIFSKINIGSNFERVSYSTGMNGVGLSLVNAVSEHFIVLANAKKKDISKLPVDLQTDYNKGNSVFCMEYKKGILQHHGMYSSIINAVDTCNSELSEFTNDNSFDDFGTIVLFLPDYSILDKSTEKYHGYPFKLLSSIVKEDDCFKDTHVSFSLNEKVIQPFKFKDHFNVELVDDRVITGNFNFNTNENLPIKFIFQFGYSLKSWNLDEDGSVNLLRTPQGIHLTYLHEAMFRAFRRYNDIMTYSDIKYGLRLFALIFAIEPSFNSQDKTKLSKLEDKGFDKNELITSLGEYIYEEILAKNREFFDLIIDRIIEYKKQIGKLSNISLLKSAVILGDEEKRFSSQGEASKVYEATSRDYASRELYLTEGLCFTGDQEILDVNLNKISFKDLVEKYNAGEDTYTFSCSKDGDVGVSKIIKAWKTKEVNELSVVTLDDNSEIKCTPDHRFMLRDGSYKEARYLKEGDSLMPLYYDKSGEYNTIKDNKTNVFNKIYHISAKHKDVLVHNSSVSSKHTQRHHIDENRKNDNPSNILICDRDYHLSLHRCPSKGNKGLQKARENSGYDSKYRQNLKDSFTEERIKNYKSKMKDVQSSSEYKKNASEKQGVIMGNSLYKKERIMKQYLTTGRNIIEFMSVNTISVSDDTYQKSIKILQEQKLISNKLTCVPSSLNVYLNLENGVLGNWSPVRPKPNRFLNNHKVKFVKIIKTKNEPVYDITVDSDNHNFPLANGVFVHNSASGSLVKYRNKKFQSILPLRGKLVNTSSFSDESLVGNKEILAIINTVGCGVGAITDVSKSKYGKIIIATDSDSDGSHISNLITALFYTHAPDLIKQGLLYKLVVPYYVVNNKDYFYYNEKDQIDFESSRIEKRKGLGSYSGDEAKKFMLVSETRKLQQIVYNDDSEKEIVEAAKLMFSSSARRKLMVSEGIINFLK